MAKFLLLLLLLAQSANANENTLVCMQGEPNETMAKYATHYKMKLAANFILTGPVFHNRPASMYYGLDGSIAIFTVVKDSACFVMLARSAVPADEETVHGTEN